MVNSSLEDDPVSIRIETSEIKLVQPSSKRNSDDVLGGGTAKHQNMFSFGNIEPAFYAEQEVVKCALAEVMVEPDISSMGKMNPNLSGRFCGYGAKQASL